jgi:uncharacterized protein YjiK
MALHLTQGRSRTLSMRGASAVAAVPGTMFLAEDDEGIYRLERGRLTLWAGGELHDALCDLEGIALDPSGTRLYALAEESGALVSVGVRGSRRVVRDVGVIPRPGRRTNKGYEGLAYLPRAHSPNGRASLVAAHEGKPRRVCIFRLPDLAQTHDLKLPREAKTLLGDLADVTIDPVSGAMLLLSEESRRIAVCRSDGDRLALESVTDIRVSEGARPEGIDFVTRDRLVVVTEAPAMAISFRVRRG